MLDAWLDLGADGKFDTVTDRLGPDVSIAVVQGNSILLYTIPADTSIGDTFSRFRVSSSGGLTPTGTAGDGEVEDYVISVLDGNAGAAAKFDLVVGEIDVSAEGNEVVARHTGQELFRVPGAALNSIEFQGSEIDNQVSLANLAGALAGSSPLIYDGQVGVDVLRLTGGDQTLDVSNTALNQLSNLERIEIVGSAANRLVVDGASVVTATDLDNTLVVVHDKDDTVDYDGDGWEVSTPIFVDDGQRHVLTNDLARIETINTLPWQNPLANTDVNFDGKTTALDALQIINFIARIGVTTGNLLPPTSVAELPERYYDVNGSETATALDALNVINFLGTQPGGGQGEQIVTNEATASTGPALTPLAVSPLSRALGEGPLLRANEYDPPSETEIFSVTNSWQPSNFESVVQFRQGDSSFEPADVETWDEALAELSLTPLTQLVASIL